MAGLAERAGQLAVDEHGAARILAARRQVIRRDQAVHDGLDGDDFNRGEEILAQRIDGFGRIAGKWRPGQAVRHGVGQHAAGQHGQRRHRCQKAAAAHLQRPIIQHAPPENLSFLPLPRC